MSASMMQAVGPDLCALEIADDLRVQQACIALRDLIADLAAARGGEVPTLAVTFLMTSAHDCEAAWLVFGDPDQDILDELADALRDPDNDDVRALPKRQRDH